MTTAEVQKMLQEDETYVYMKRFDFSIEKLEARYPDGCPDHVIAQALMITEEDVEIMYQMIVAKLRSAMRVAL
jgi:hypothetical protein